jgi:hypothetical protein
MDTATGVQERLSMGKLENKAEIVEQVIEENKELIQKLEDRPLSTEEQEYLNFVRKNHERCRMWIASNRNMNFPIMLTKEGYVWVNRSTRRKLRKRRT